MFFPGRLGDRKQTIYFSMPYGENAKTFVFLFIFIFINN